MGEILSKHDGIFPEQIGCTFKLFQAPNSPTSLSRLVCKKWHHSNLGSGLKVFFKNGNPNFFSWKPVFFLANSVKTAATRNFINWWVNCTTRRYTSWIHLSETTSYMSRVLSVAPTVFDTTKPRLDGGQYVLKDACLLWIKWLKRSMLWFAVLLVCIGWIWLEGSFLHRCVLVSLLWRPK